MLNDWLLAIHHRAEAANRARDDKRQEGVFGRLFGRKR